MWFIVSASFTLHMEHLCAVSFLQQVCSGSQYYWYLRLAKVLIAIKWSNIIFQVFIDSNNCFQCLLMYSDYKNFPYDILEVVCWHRRLLFCWGLSDRVLYYIVLIVIQNLHTRISSFQIFLTIIYGTACYVLNQIDFLISILDDAYMCKYDLVRIQFSTPIRNLG